MQASFRDNGTCHHVTFISAPHHTDVLPRHSYCAFDSLKTVIVSWTKKRIYHVCTSVDFQMYPWDVYSQYYNKMAKSFRGKVVRIHPCIGDFRPLMFWELVASRRIRHRPVLLCLWSHPLARDIFMTTAVFSSLQYISRSCHERNW